MPSWYSTCPIVIIDLNSQKVVSVYNVFYYLKDFTLAAVKTVYPAPQYAVYSN